MLGISNWSVSIKVKCFPEMYRGAKKLSIKRDMDVACMDDEGEACHYMYNLGSKVMDRRSISLSGVVVVLLLLSWRHWFFFF